MMQYYLYGEKEIQHLKAQDYQLAAVIDEIGWVQRRVITDPFKALVHYIIEQQISLKAAKTVIERVCVCVGGEIEATAIHALSLDTLQQCGMSMRKAQYIKGIAAEIVNKALCLTDFHHWDDSEIVQRLCALKGVGLWTAEMMLMMTFLRPDVVSFGDLAIRRAMMVLYDEPVLTKTQFEQYREQYRPFGTVASFYLWAYYARSCVNKGVDK